MSVRLGELLGLPDLSDRRALDLLLPVFPEAGNVLPRRHVRAVLRLRRMESVPLLESKAPTRRWLEAWPTGPLRNLSGLAI